MANKTATAAGFHLPSFTNTSATGTGVGTFVYGANLKANGTTAWDDVAAMKASGFFNDAALVLNKGAVITLTDGATTENVCVTSAANVTPVTVA